MAWEGGRTDGGERWGREGGGGGGTRREGGGGGRKTEGSFSRARSLLRAPGGCALARCCVRSCVRQAAVAAAVAAAARGMACACVPWRPCRWRPRGRAVGTAGGAAFGTASSVDRDSIACMRFSPARARTARAGLAALGLAALWRGASDSSRPRHVTRGGDGGGGDGGGSRERVMVQGGCKAGRGAARSQGSCRRFRENSDIVCAAAAPPGLSE
jgi:hypothetical protein